MARPKTKLLLIIAAFACLASSVVFFAHAFRVDKSDNPSLGIIEYRYRWGRAHEVRADSNRDGEIDFRARFESSRRFFGHSDSPKEYWEDRDYDGSFEIHVVMDGDKIKLVNVDQNGDGMYERTLTGKAAEKFYSSAIFGELTGGG